jgi:CHAD domain-containing protein
MAAEFLPPDEMTLEAAGEALTGVLAERDGSEQEVDRTFFDTFDGLLYDEGLLFTHEDGRIVLSARDNGQELASLDAPPPTQPLLADELPAGALRDALAPVSGVRALLPLVHVHSRLRALRVLDDERKTVVRMTLEEPALVSSSNRHTALRPRVRLALVRGYDAELERVQAQLEHELGFRPADQPLVDEAVRAAGGAPGGISSKPDVHLSYNQRSDEAVVRVLKRMLEVIELNFEGTIADIDTEFLHDFRVSVRRTRSVQRELKQVFPPAELERFRIEFRWLQQITGDSRDLDVYVLEFDDYRAMVPEEIRADLDPLLGVLRRRRAAAHREMVRKLRSERAATIRREWEAFLDALPGLPAGDRPDGARPIGAVAGERIAKVYKRMVKMGRAIDDSSPPEDYHELRKKGKELRYLLELFAAPVYPTEVVKPMIKALKSLQDVLGRHQDREVQVATMRSLRDEISVLPDGAAALMAMGVLVEHLAFDERAARGEFAERFSAFADKSQRMLVKETFT